MGIKVLVVDDSATARAIISDILQSSSHIESVDTAPDAYVARDKIVKNNAIINDTDNRPLYS